MEWVVNMTEHFSRLVTMSVITSHINLLATGSIPVEGSLIKKNVFFKTNFVVERLNKIYNFYRQEIQ